MFRGTIMSSCASAFASKVCTYRKTDIYSMAFLHIVEEQFHLQMVHIQDNIHVALLYNQPKHLRNV